MFPYSLSFKINPLTFKNVTTLNTPHDIGLIWGSVIFDLYWRLIESNGFSTNWYDSKQAKGNIILMNLIIATLKTQVCNPSFLDARNALLSADEQVSGGKYKCKIWQAFAARGMGIHAKEKLRDFVFDYEQVTESFKIPRICIIRNFFRGIIDGMTGNKS